MISLIEQEIIKTEKKIIELEKECTEWETYNKKENDITRSEINSLKKYIDKLIKDAKKLGIEFYKIDTKKEPKKQKKPTYKQLAEYLGVSEQAVKQYPRIKRDLMVAGFAKYFDCNITREEKQIIANTLFEFVEQNNQDITRDKEIKKIRSIYKKLYSEIN